MKKVYGLMILAVLVLPAVLIASEEGQEEKATTISGEVVDLSCYMDHGAKGEKHAKCAKMCIEKGLPMGILTKSGDVYLVVENHHKASAYAELKGKAAQQVTVTGEVVKKGGLQAIVVSAVK